MVHKPVNSECSRQLPQWNFVATPHGMPPLEPGRDQNELRETAGQRLSVRSYDRRVAEIHIRAASSTISQLFAFFKRCRRMKLPEVWVISTSVRIARQRRFECFETRVCGQLSCSDNGGYQI